MLESGDCLQTWRLDKNPQEIDSPSEAVKIFDHPLKFLTYEGPVNEGKGRVQITNAGKYEVMHENNERIELDLYGRILKGKFTLTHVKDDHWQFAP
jgi:bifunctional non-homologous end joining protein LigD